MAAGLLALCLALAGCAATKSFFASRPALKEVNFDVSRKANDSAPFAVELVAVSDDTLLPKLLALSADQWFDPEATFKRDYPAMLQTWYYELTPGLALRVEEENWRRRGTRAVLLFANYKGKGAFRLRLDPYPNAHVLFAEKTIELAPP